MMDKRYKPKRALEGLVEWFATLEKLKGECPSSDNLRLIRLFAKGGSGSSGVRV
jgi:hypothetical protein